MEGSRSRVLRTPLVWVVVSGLGAAFLGTAQSATAQGLVAAYSFDEGTGTAVADASGTGNGGTVSNATWTTAGRYGNALVFNGTSSRVTVADSASLRLTTAMTLEAWVYPTSVTSSWRDILYKGDDNYFLEASTHVSSRPAAGGTFGEVFGTTALTANTWTHLAVTYDKVNLRFYVNGTQVASVAQTSNIATSANPLQIGSDSFYGQYFNGRIDEVRVYNVALTPAQVQSDMNTSIGGGAPPDTQPPTAPGSLTATAAGTTQINLAWTASTDNVGVTGYRVERCQGAGCTGFAQIATPTGTSFNDTGLTAGTTYRYQVRAADAAGNLSPYSNIATAATDSAPDTQPPTAPGSLTATAAGTTQINLAWTASTDNVGVTGYRVERCQGAGCTGFAQIATPTGTSFNDTGLTAGTTYRYQVRAADAAGNLSPYSNIATAATNSAPDTQPPTAPGSLTATAASSSQINLAWTAATDDVGVTGYRVERCQGAGCSSFAQIATPTSTSFNDTGLATNTSYTYRVLATDAASNLGPYSNQASATTLATTAGLVAAYSFDEGTGTAVADASGTGNGGTVSNATWTTAGRYGNALVFNGTSSRVSVADSPSLRLTTAMTLEAWVYPTSVTSSWRDILYKGDDNYFLEASTHTSRPAAGGTFGEVFGTTALTANTWTHLAVTYDKVNLRFYVDGTQVASVAQTGNIATSTNPLQIGSDSFYGQYFNGRIDEVRVYNVALTPDQVLSDMNTPIGGGAPPPDTQPPTAPASLTATAAGTTQINLAWTASTDNVGVTGYRVERCQGAGCTGFTQIATPPGTSFNDTGLAAGTTYRYQVRATDAAGNLSPYSNIASATTNSAGDTEPPTPPGSLTATAAGMTHVNLGWIASTDNVGVTGYRVERCQGAGCTSFAQIATPTGTSFYDTGLTAGTTYRYQVRAADAAGNLSPYSNIASATTTTDTQPPTAPGSLTATAASSSQINLAWTAATDNVGVTGYRVERCQGAGCSSFAQIATPTSTSFNDTGLATNTSYTYRVLATDAASNLGPYSNQASATTLATTAGLVAAYSFDEGTGTAVADASGTGNGGTVSDTTWTTDGRHGKALMFNGATSWVTVNDAASLRLTTAMTLEAWVRPTAVNGSWRDVIYKGDDNYFLMATSSIASRPAAGGTFGEVFGATALALNTWTHLAVTYDKVNLRMYVNGTQVASVPRTANIATSNHPLRIGGDSIYGQHFSGTIDEVRVYNQALSQAQIQTDMNTPIGPSGPPPTDTTPPTVSLTGPPPGSVLNGTVLFDATASDAGSGVGGVQFQVDGLNVGPAIVTPPYTLSFNTAQLANGPHSIGVYAWDNAKNVGTGATVGVTFSNTTPGAPDQTGLWSGLFPWPLVAVHAHLLRTGQVLASDGQSLGNVAFVWDPVTSLFRDAAAPDNIFCAGHALLPDGRVMVAGGHISGHVGIQAANIFDPVTFSWTTAPPMVYQRWYPTVTALPDGRSLVTQGETSCAGCNAGIPEVYNPATNSWSLMTTANQPMPYYPHMYVLPDGRVYAAGTSMAPITTRVLNLATQTWSVVESSGRDGGSSAMYLPGKILKSGKSVDPDNPGPSSLNTAYVIDMTQPSPSWRQVASMAFQRTYHTLTLLPDGNVLATGGGTTTNAVGLANAVLPAELWSPTTETWTTLAPMHAPRLYHSIAMLLPDARVLISGGGRFNDINEPTDQLSGEIYAPPYLFKGPRPTITSAPTQLTYNQPFTVQTPDAASVSKVVLMGIASVTHSINMNQRHLPLSFTAGTGTLEVTAPANANLAPPGYYMLFIINANGVPSIASILKL